MKTKLLNTFLLRNPFYLLVLLLLVSKISLGQSDSIKKIWGNIGIVTTNNDRRGFQTGINSSFKKNVISLKYYQNEEFMVGFPFEDYRLNNIQKIQNLSLLYGRSFGNKYIQLIPMAGPSIGKGVWRNDKVDIEPSSGEFSLMNNRIYHYDKFDYVGLNLNLEFMWTPTKYFGVGVNVFENIHKHPDFGFGFNIIIGRLR